MLHPDNPINKSLESLSIVEVQNELFKLFEQVEEIFRENNIIYFIGFGTLLGAIRHGGFIPWDDDIDIIIPKDEIDRAQEVLRKHLPNHYSIINIKNGELSWDIDVRIRDNRTILDTEVGTIDSGIYIDIIEMPEISRNNRQNYVKLKKIKRTILSTKRSFIQKIIQFFPYMRISIVFALKQILSKERFLLISDKPSGGLYKSEDVFPLCQLMFRGKPLNAPKDYDKILTEMYGDYMKIPAESERKQHFQDCYRKA